MEIVIMINLIVTSILLVLIGGYVVYMLFAEKQGNEFDNIDQQIADCENEIIVLTAEINNLKKDLNKANKEIKSLIDELKFVNENLLNTYAEQNDMWAEIERLSNEQETLRNHTIENDKLNLAKFSKIANLLKGGKNDWFWFIWNNFKRAQ